MRRLRQRGHLSPGDDLLSVLPAELPANAPAGQPRTARPRRSRQHPAPSRAAGTTFTALGVATALVTVLAQDGITAPRPIQAAVLPDALAGRDILGCAQTGSGKTLGFSLPLVARLARGHTMACRPRGLVLVPTRELATQVEAVLSPLAGAMGLTVAVIFGGTPQRPQVAALRNRVDIVVACPGRLADLIGQGHCHLGDVEISVLDEADHMADLGFLPVVRRLMEATPREGQRMLFSATLDNAVDVLVRRFLRWPTDIAARGIRVDGIGLVVHADPPAGHKAYLHRSGRTARAGSGGVVITLQSPAQAAGVRGLMRRAGVSPLAATVSPGSALLRSIAGPPAARAAGACRRRGGAACQPGYRPRRGGNVGQLPGAPQAVATRPAALSPGPDARKDTRPREY